MLTVTLYLAQHKDAERIFIDAPVNNELYQLLRRVTGIRWSSTKKRWHLPVSKQAIDDLAATIKKIAVLDTDQLREQLISRKKLVPAIKKNLSPTLVTSFTVNQNNLKALEDFLKILVLKAYSISTIKTYKNEFLQLLKILNEINVQDLTTEQLKRYLLWCIAQGLTENTIHSRINALKFYFEQVLKQEKIFFEIPRPKKPFLLPKVISEEKIIKGLFDIKNLKHKTLLLLAYSAGLRVSEVVSLQLTDVNSDRMQININRAKGKKDRVVTLSKSILEILRDY